MGLAVLLVGCDRAAQNTQNTLPERQVPAQPSTPVTALNTEAPAMPRTSDRPADPLHERDTVKTEADLEAAMVTPTNQWAVSSHNDPPPQRSGPSRTESYDGNQVVNR